MENKSNHGLYGGIVGSVPPASLSPYFNIDPGYLNQSTPEFILPAGQQVKRGRFELAFSQIGTSVMAGGLYGVVNGLKISLTDSELKKLPGRPFKVPWRTQFLNVVGKQAASSANTLGVIALLYSGFGVLLQLGRGEDDEINTVIAATSTGLLYKGTNGWKKSIRGGVVGLTLSGIYCLWLHRDKFHLGGGSHPAY